MAPLLMVRGHPTDLSLSGLPDSRCQSSFGVFNATEGLLCQSHTFITLLAEEEGYRLACIVKTECACALVDSKDCLDGSAS